MAHFAKIENNLVTQVIVVGNEDTLDEQGNESEAVGIKLCFNLLGGEWKQTSYNSNIRKNFASIGMEYDSTRDAFITLSPYDSWVLNEDTCTWESPIPYPDVKKDKDDNPIEFYYWEEETLEWVKDTLETFN